MADRDSSPWQRLGLLSLPAAPPWDGTLVLARTITLRQGDSLRVRMAWSGTEGGYVLQIDALGAPFKDE